MAMEFAASLLAKNRLNDLSADDSYRNYFD